MSRVAVTSGGHPPRPSVAEIALRNIQVRWLLKELGLQGAASDSTFNEYLKSLRKLGSPFEPGEINERVSRFAVFRFHHIVELALALTLRVYNGLPDTVLIAMIGYRRALNRLYLRAYSERAHGIGAPFAVRGPDGLRLELSGAYLDLQINFSGGVLTGFGPPRLVTPAAAVSAFVASDPGARAFLPIRLSALCERIVDLAAAAPAPRRLRRSVNPDAIARRKAKGPALGTRRGRRRAHPT